MVYVLSKDGQPLMPTKRYGKVRRMLQSGKAKVIKRCPFTIQLAYDSTTHTQPVTLGIDTGVKHIGTCASTERESLYEAQTEQRADVSKNLESRKSFRRSRRSRKTRYRKPRFLNRKSSKPNGWIAPSVRQLTEVHIRESQFVASILPITKIVVETAEFDIHRIKDPSVKGLNYQFGEKYGFEQNTRNYVLFRDNHKCRFCGNDKGKLYVCAADGKSTTAPEDLYTFCRDCYIDLTKGKIKVPKKRYFAPPTKMGIMRDEILKGLKETFPDIEVIKTTGAVTKAARESHGIDKSHISDAYVIAGNLKAVRASERFLRKKVRCHNRQIHKATINKGGIRKRNQTPYETKGFRLFDKVKFSRQECFIFGRRSSGSMDVRLLDGTKISPCAGYKKLKLLEKRKTILTERRPA